MPKPLAPEPLKVPPSEIRYCRSCPRQCILITRPAEEVKEPITASSPPCPWCNASFSWRRSK